MTFQSTRWGTMALLIVAAYLAQLSGGTAALAAEGERLAQSDNKQPLPFHIEDNYWDRGPGQKRPAPPPDPGPVDRGPVEPAPPQVTDDGYTWTQMVWPTGDKRTGALWVQKGMPRMVAMNEEFEQIVKVTNLTSMELIDVNVWDQVGEGFEVVSTEPQHEDDGGRLHWRFNKMEPHSTKTITVRGKATQTGDITNCVEVSYRALLCNTTKVVEPKLVLEKQMTAEALQCDPIIANFVVKNTGSGPANNVKIEDKLPDGLLTQDGKNTVSIPIGTLAAGQSRNVSVELKATKAGTFENAATAMADGGLTAEAKSSVKVTKPKLELAQKCPKTAYLKRVVCSDITVTNKGDGVAKNAAVVIDIPAGTELVSADGGTAEGLRVTFNLGNLAPEASKTVKVCYRPSKEGTYKIAAAAKAYCAEAVASTCQTEIVGIPAILLEVVDKNDPVQVGNNEVYTIIATNQGSQAGKDVTITVTLEDEAEYVNSDGSATRATVDGKKITFAPIDIPVGQQRKWMVVTKAVAAGDIRFTVQMTEAQLNRPVTENEATNFFE